MRKKHGVRLAALLTLLVWLPVMALAAEFAVVRGGKLNLRRYANSASDSLGKYDSGTWVRVDGNATNGFVPVRTLDGKSGYMSAGYLTRAVSGQSGVVRYANGGYVNLRRGPSLDYAVVTRVTSGTGITILDDSYEWNYVSAVIGGTTYKGYMHDSLIDKGAGTMYVSTKNGGKVNVRSGPSSSYSSIGTLNSGTKVQVLLKGKDWYQISANGLTGFMTASYLGSAGGSGSGGSSSGTTATQIAYVNNPVSTQVLNLREQASQSARSIGQYKNGTQVKVVAKGATWSEVYVGTRHGYMMTRYLSFTGSYATQPPQYVYVTPTPQVVYVTPTPTPYIQYITPTPKPLVEYITPKPQQTVSAPSAGTAITLAVAAGSTGSKISVYDDASLTSLKGTYEMGKKATMLKYDDNACMILIDGGVGYVSTWNVNY